MPGLARLSAALLVLLATIGGAGAQSIFEKLILPGDVVEHHAKFEKKCDTCHEPFSKKSQRRLCLDCHKDVSGDISANRGFHGKRTDVVSAECKTCHTDHKGRDFDIIQFDSETFNHRFSDFELKGRHRVASCSGCHASGKKYRDTPSACISCHKNGDVHKGSLGENCASCHSEDGWKKAKPFDHGKTKFPLDGAHRTVQCSICHAGERYKDLPHACIDCHKIQDVHGGRFGQKCQTCHASDKWKSVIFDHAKVTTFPLNGAHATVKCQGCHTGEIYVQKLATECVSCHRKDDPHKGSLGSRCQSCHNESDWRKKLSFDHDMSRFPLVGLHAAVPCESCHRNETYRNTPKACSDCHKDVHHEGKLGAECARCHNPNGWALWRFDHNTQAKFALTGAHVNLQCQSCHKERAVAKVTAPLLCFGCHSQDDTHRGGFGRSCETCHTTTSFRDVLNRR